MLFNSKKTNEFVVSSYDYSGNIIIAKFDKDLIGFEDENTSYDSESLFHVSGCNYDYASLVYFSESNSY